MSRRLFLAGLAALCCGRGGLDSVAPGLQQYAGGETTLVGELRTTAGAAPKAGRLFVRDESGAHLVSGAADEAGHFELVLPSSGRITFVAVDGDGSAARGGFRVQPHGVNDLGRIWLGSSAASPWLVEERGLGLEERLSAVPLGLHWTALAGPRGPVVTDGASVLEWNASTGALDTRAQGPVGELGGAAYLRYGQAALPADCWAGTRSFAGSSEHPAELVVWDLSTGVEHVRYPTANRWVMHLHCSPTAFQWVTAEPGPSSGLIRFTARRIDRATGAQTVLGFVDVRGVMGSTVSPPNGWLSQGGAVLPQTDIDPITGQMRSYAVHWDYATGARTEIASVDFEAVLSADGRRMLQRRYSPSRVELIELPTQTAREVVRLEPGTHLVSLMASDDARWGLVVLAQSTMLNGEVHTRYRFERVSFESGTVEHLELPPGLPATGFTTSQLFIERSGDVLFLGGLGDEVWVASTAGWVTHLAPGEALVKALFNWDAQVVDGRTLVLVARREPTSAEKYSADATVFSGPLGGELARRTFAGGGLGTLAVLPPYVYYPRRDPLSGLTQLYRLAVAP